LNAGRAAGAARLTRLVRLDRHVVIARADATALPFARARFDACVSQEAFLHIADKATVIGECRRVLRPGGRLAFTDWIAQPRLGEAWYRDYQQVYGFFVGLVEDGKLGGGRLSGTA